MNFPISPTIDQEYTLADKTWSWNGIGWALVSVPGGGGSEDYAPLSHVGAGDTEHALVTTTVAGFMSAADKTKLDSVPSDLTTQLAAKQATLTSSTSITLSGNELQRAALTGDVTSPSNSNATTIANNAVTTVKINNSAVTLAKMANMATLTLLGNATGAAAAPQALTAAQVRTLLNVANGATANTGTVTSVSAGNGMTFTTITGSGSVALGTPGTLTNDTTDAVTASSHTHSLQMDGLYSNDDRSGTIRTTPDTYRLRHFSAALNTGANIGIAGTYASTLTFCPWHVYNAGYRPVQFIFPGDGHGVYFRTAATATTWDTMSRLLTDADGVVLNTIGITAGNGLTGGGLLSATRTVTMGTPGTVGPATTNSVTTSSHTHNLDLTGDYTWTGTHTFMTRVVALGLQIPNLVVTEAGDVTGHIQLHSSSGGYGFNITTSTLNIVVAGASRIAVGTSGVVINNPLTVNGTISDSVGDVRKLSATTFNSTGNITAVHLNQAVEKSNNTAYTYTLTSGIGAQGDAITFVNSGTAGNLTIARASGVTLYRYGTNANIVVAPGSMVTIYRSATSNRWVA